MLTSHSLGLESNGMVGHAVTLENVLDIAKESNITFKHGDILFIRSGFTKTWESITLDEKKEYRAKTQEHKHRHSGLIQSEAVARFLWDNHIVACAGKSFHVAKTRCRDLLIYFRRRWSQFRSATEPRQ